MITGIIYIGAFLLSCLFSKMAEKKDKKKYLFLSVLILTFIAGFRSISVGIDTMKYDSYFTMIANGKIQHIYGLEEGFKYLCLVLLEINNSNTFLFVVFAFITNYFVLFRFWDYRTKASLMGLVACYYIMFFFPSLNTMRQCCAVSIIFYFNRFLEKERYIKYFIVVLFTAILFHKSALLGLCFFAFEFVKWKVLTKKQKRLLLMGVLCIPLVIPYLMGVFEDYQHYFTSDTFAFNFGLMTIAKFILLIISVILMYNKEHRYLKINAPAEYAELIAVRMYFGIGLLLTSLEYFFPFMGRIGYYFSIYEGIYIGKVCKNVRGNVIIFYQACQFLLFSYIFVSNLLYDGYGVIPYVFTWNS